MSSPFSGGVGFAGWTALGFTDFETPKLLVGEQPVVYSADRSVVPESRDASFQTT